MPGVMLSLRLDPMKRALLIAIGAFVALVAVVVAANWMFVSRPYMGKVIESWETSNQAFRVRVDQHSEENSFGAITFSDPLRLALRIGAPS